MKKESLLKHLVGWCGMYFFWVMVFQKKELAFSQTATVGFCYLFFIGLNYYFNVYYNIPRFLQTRKYALFIGQLLAGVTVTAAARVPLSLYLNSHYFSPGKPQPPIGIIFSQSFLNIFIWVVCIVSAKIIVDRFRVQQYIDQIEKEKQQAELNFLNAQFNPHFLFNSIHSIYGHIDRQNQTARNMLLSFSDMLRYQLYECNSKTISVEKELGYIRNYIDLQKERKNEDLDIRLDIAENVKDFFLAPLLFMAFVENSFKWVGSDEKSKPFIHVSFNRDRDDLLFSCANSKEAEDLKDGTHEGIGISNTKRRLSLLYPNRHILDIRNEKQVFEVNLKINMA